MGTRDGQTFNGNQAGAAEYPYSLGANYGVLAYDNSHIFNAAYVVNLPSPIHGNHILEGTVNGWEFSGNHAAAKRRADPAQHRSQ